MRFSSRFLGWLFVVLTLASVLNVTAGSSQAGFLAVGGALVTPAEPDPIGGLVIDSSTIPFATPLYTGTLISQVIFGDATNPFGGLTFTYQIVNNATSTNALSRFSINNFASFLVDASYQIPAVGIAPLSVDRFTADTVGFNFSSLFGGAGPIVPGSPSSLMVLQTNANNYAVTSGAIQDGLNTTALSFAPTAVPEPGSLLLLGSAVSALGFTRRRRA